MRLVGCIRVSRVGGRTGESFISPQQQRDRIIHHAHAHGHEMVGWHEDLDQPGSRMNRPGLEAALRQIEAGEADGLAVAKLDRFARSVAGAAKTLDRLEKAGGVLVAVDLGMDTSTPAGKLMRNVLMALAEFELDRIRENWRDADRRAIERGVQIAPKVVLGYRRRPDGRLEPDPKTAAVAREAFLMRGRGETWAAISLYLDRYAPKPNRRPWIQSTLTGLLASRTYLGELSHGATVNTGAHEPLVTRQEWEAAQAFYARPRTRSAGLLLAGIIRCAGCSYPMTQQGSGLRGYLNYKCRGRYGGGICPEPSRISVLRADPFVVERFLAFAGTEAVTDDELTVDIERATAAVENAEAELVAYRDGQLVSVLGPRVYREGLELRARRVDDARQELAGIRRHNVPLRGDAPLAEEWERLSLAERRALLGAAIDAVFVRRAHLKGQAAFEHRLFICWAGDGPRDLPGRRLSEVRRFVFPNEAP